MPIWFPSIETIVTAAPGTGSTSLLEACRRSDAAVDLAEALHLGPEQIDRKHATVADISARTSFRWDGQVVTTTRDPFDFYVAEWTRSRTRWAAELSDPDSWVNTVDGARNAIELAQAHGFSAWLEIVLHDDLTGGRQRRLNAGHVDEATVVARMESVDDDLVRLHPDLAREIGPIPRLNVTDRSRDLGRVYSGRALRAVATVHADDLDRFGYEPPVVR